VTPLEILRRLVADWFGKAVPAVPGDPRWHEQALTQSETEAEALRRSVRQVTLEQLGIAHWSCHTHF